MKSAAKIFIILGMIFGIILIYPFILGFFTLDKIDKANSSKDLKEWGIVCILFVSTLGGIFMLCIKDSELSTNDTVSTTTPLNANESDKAQKRYVKVNPYEDTSNPIDDFIFAEICDEL